MRRFLQHHRYALAVTLRRLARHPCSFLTNMAVIAFALTLPLLGASVLISVQPLSQHISANPSMTIFMKPAATGEQTRALVQRIQKEKDPAILNVQFVSKEQALNDLKRNDAWQQALSVLNGNPLPHAVTVTLKTEDAMAQTAASFARQWQSWDHVEFIQLDSLWVQRLEALLKLGRIGLGLVTLIIALVVLAAVFNTVRMQALSQRDEIAVARLVGATESFVRRPFLYQGGLTCALSALIAIALAALALSPVNEALAPLARTYDSLYVMRLPPLVYLGLYCLAAIGLGAFSARWSVTRHTRF